MTDEEKLNSYIKHVNTIKNKILDSADLEKAHDLTLQIDQYCADKELNHAEVLMGSISFLADFCASIEDGNQFASAVGPIVLMLYKIKIQKREIN